MRFIFVYLFAALLLPAQNLSIERLFSRPFLWGTWPSQISWAKKSHQLGFLWNAHGEAFRDLYVYDADAKKLTRLTDLKGQRDPINDSEAEQDVHRKNYLPPPAGVSSFDLSEDGKQAVFSYRGDLYLTATSGGPVRRLTKTKAPENNPQFSSDGTRIAFTESGQLFVMVLGGGLIEQKTDIKAPASLQGFDWSPDGKSLSYAVQTKPERSLILPNYSGQFVVAPPFPRSVAGDEPEAEQLYIIASTGDNPARPLDLGKNFYPARAPKWSPDGRKLIVIVQNSNYKSQEIRVVDAVNSTSVTVFKQTDNTWIEVSDAGWDQQSKQLWFTSDQPGFKQLFTVNADGSGLRQLTKGDWEIHNDPFSHAPQWVGNYIYYSSTEKSTAERQFYRVSASGGNPEQLSSREGLNIGWVSEDGEKRALMEADSRNPFDLYVDGSEITHSPLPEFYQTKWAETRYLTYPSLKDHKPVAARLMLPPGFNPDDANQKPRPAIVYIHGSGYATSVLKQWGSYQELRYAFNTYLASRGYVILEMDYRGSTGYGRDWRTGVYLNMGGPDLEDVLGGVEYLRSLKNIDMKNVGIWGWSYGGFMTATALFKAPGVFKAGAAFSGVYDWRNYNAGYTDARLTTPAENPEVYRRSSPIHFSGQLQDHLLILHGIVDSNVLFQDAVQLSEKLIHENKSFEESFYPEENHAFVRDESLQSAFGKAAAFFDTNLHDR